MMVVFEKMPNIALLISLPFYFFVSLMPVFSHLHCHTQYSLLDGAAPIKDMVAKAQKDGMPAVALTDHGNMFGAFEFVNAAKKAGIIPWWAANLCSGRPFFSALLPKNKKINATNQPILIKIGRAINFVKIVFLWHLLGVCTARFRVWINRLSNDARGFNCEHLLHRCRSLPKLLFKGEAVAELVFWSGWIF
ncbi:MAG: PHP domain-containing protein [Sphingobacteriales bacterium]|nr:PHP domain-containing protein [Sphingobacteriales bacterium]